jgi:hypothetical protein
LPFFKHLQAQLVRSLIPLKRVESIVRPLHCRSQPVNLSHRLLEHHRLPRESAAERSYFFGEIKLVSHGDPEKGPAASVRQTAGLSFLGRNDARTSTTPSDNARRKDNEARP